MARFITPSSMETVPRLDGTPGGKRGAPALDTDTDSTREIKTHFRVCRFIMETGTVPKQNPSTHIHYGWSVSPCLSRCGCRFLLQTSANTSEYIIILNTAFISRIRCRGLAGAKACTTLTHNTHCLPRCEVRHAFGARGDSVRVVPPVLPVCECDGVRALPGGDELHLPSRQGGGAAPPHP